MLDKRGIFLQHLDAGPNAFLPKRVVLLKIPGQPRDSALEPQGTHVVVVLESCCKKPDGVRAHIDGREARV